MISVRESTPLEKAQKKKGAIDQVLTNPRGYKHVHSMFIDEDGEFTETSDHDVVLTYLNLKHNEKKWEKGKSEIRTYFSLDEDKLELFIKDLKENINQNTNLKNLHIKIEAAQEKNLKIQKKMKLGKKYDKITVEPAWVDEELKTEIKKRRKLNRTWRKSQKKQLHIDIQKENETNYKTQKQIAKKLTAEKKGSWEKNKILEAKESNGKTLWKVVNEIQGKTKPKNKKTYIYTDDEEKKEVKEIWEEFVNYWRITIYQKDNSRVSEKWYGNNKNKGWRISYVSYLDNLIKKEEEKKIMQIPIINEEELLERSNNLKNGKAAGIDGVKGEVIKKMMKDKKINIWVSA